MFVLIANEHWLCSYEHLYWLHL